MKTPKTYNLLSIEYGYEQGICIWLQTLEFSYRFIGIQKVLFHIQKVPFMNDTFGYIQATECLKIQKMLRIGKYFKFGGLNMSSIYPYLFIFWISETPFLATANADRKTRPELSYRFHIAKFWPLRACI